MDTENEKKGTEKVNPDYQMTDRAPTSVSTLVRGVEIGEEAGLKQVYVENIPGKTKDYENTYCPRCRELLIKRMGYMLLAYRLTAQEACLKCRVKIVGVWEEEGDSGDGDWKSPAHCKAHLHGLGMMNRPVVGKSTSSTRSADVVGVCFPQSRY